MRLVRKRSKYMLWFLFGVLVKSEIYVFFGKINREKNYVDDLESLDLWESLDYH